MKLDLSKINSEKAKQEHQARRDMQEQHIEEKFGKFREEINRHAETEQNFAVLNFVMSLHSFTHLKGIDLLNEIQKYMSVHYNRFEDNVRKLVEHVGEDKLEEIGIDPKTFYPTEYCTEGLREIAAAARARAKAGKYGIKLEKPKKIEL